MPNLGGAGRTYTSYFDRIRYNSCMFYPRKVQDRSFWYRENILGFGTVWAKTKLFLRFRNMISSHGTHSTVPKWKMFHTLVPFPVAVIIVVTSKLSSFNLLKVLWHNTFEHTSAINRASFYYFVAVKEFAKPGQPHRKKNALKRHQLF